MSGITSYARPIRGASNDWITPREITQALGEFDLDPCASLTQPWSHAERQYTIEDNGLVQPWEGRVWVNPPYGDETRAWLGRLAEHGRGTALVFARTETVTFDRTIWRKATALLFIIQRVHFYRPDGTRTRDAGGPSVLVAYGDEDAEILSACGIRGAFVHGWTLTL